MRNLKKVLSLALALVMMLGMMVVGAGATEFRDDSSIEYKEAAEVLNSLNVILGRDDGSFDPKGNLRRAEGAAIIYRMLTGGMTTSPAGGVSGFVDVDGDPAYSYASGIVAYLANKGIVSGVDATHFAPGDPLTGAAFGKMLLVALGYNAEYQGYVGGGWDGNVMRDCYGRGISVDGVNMSNVITREQAAQMSLNTLTATMVSQRGGIQIGDVVIPGDLAQDMPNKSGSGFLIGYTNDSDMQFCEAYFPTLKLDVNAGIDDFGHYTYAWKLDKEVIATVADEADVVITDYVANEAALKKLLPKDTDIGTVTPTYVGTTGSDVSTLADVAGLTGQGKRVELYIDEDTKMIYDIIVTVYRVETVVSVNERNTGTAYKFSYSGTKTNQTDEDPIVIFDGTLEADDVVTTVSVGNKLYVYPTTSFNGSQSAFNTTKKTIVVNGTTYTVGVAVTGVSINDFKNSDDDAAYYVDQFGFVVKTTAPEAAPEYIYIVDAVAEKTVTMDGNNVKVTVRGVLTDGTVGEYVLKTKIDTDLYCDKVQLAASSVLSNTDSAITSAVKTSLTTTYGRVFSYTGDASSMTLTAVTPIANNTAADKTVRAPISTYKGETSISSTGSSTVLMNNSTVFVLYDSTAKTARVVTGTAGLGQFTGTAKIDGVAVLTTTKTASGPASVVFGNDPKTFVDNGTYAYLDGTYTTVRIDGKNVKKYTGIMPDGNTVGLYGDGGTGVYAYDADNKITGAIISGDTLQNTPNARMAMYGVLVEGSDSYAVKSASNVYYPVNSDTSIYIKSTLDVVDGNIGYVVLDNNGKNIAAIFVVANNEGTISNTVPSTSSDPDQDISNAFAGGATEVTVNKALGSSDSVTVPAGKTLTLTKTPDASAAITLGDGATLKLGAEVALLPTISGKGNVTLAGTDATTTFDNFCDNYGTDVPALTAPDAPATSKVAPAVDAEGGITFSGAGKVTGYSSTMTLDQLATATGSTTFKMMNFTVPAAAADVVKVSYFTGDNKDLAANTAGWKRPSGIDSGTGSTAGATLDAGDIVSNNVEINFYVGDKVTGIKIDVTTGGSSTVSYVFPINQ